MLTWVVLNFDVVIYSNSSELTYSLIGPLATARKVICMNKVCPSFCLEVFLELALWLFLELHIVLGTHVVLCMTARLFEIMFCPKKWENRPILGFVECIGKFSFLSQFFNFLSIWSKIKVCITVITVCLNKFHIWESSGSWHMAQNALGLSDCGIFQSIAGL